MPEDVKVSEEWRKIPLLEKLAFIKGKAPRKFYNFKEKNTIRYLTPEYLRGRNHETLYCNINEAEIVNDDVVLLWDGSNAGEIFFAKDGAIASTMAKIEIDEKLHKRFFYYYLKFHEPIFKYQIKGSGIPHVEKDIFGLLPNTFPPLPEQRKIAEILETVDNAIEKTDRIIEKYKRIKQGLMQDLLTKGIDENGQIRSEETHKFKDSPLGRIPEEWEVVELDEVADIRLSNVDKKIKPNEVTVKLCNYLEVYQNEYITSTLNFMRGTITKNEKGKFMINKGDVIITKDSETFEDIAKPTYIKDEIKDLVCGYHLCLLKPYTNLVNGLYLAKIIGFHRVNKHFQNLANGITRFGLSKDTIANALIPLPPLPEQKRIASILSQIDETIEKEQKYKEKLERIKRGLMEDLLTGTIRVSSLIEGGPDENKKNTYP
ncbi:restriction endonuclease subunit S [Thermosulfurimonas dismutans]|uniref:Type I restriction-modification system, specificity subunit S n=1 Tax=Thermosulfurimonas dismutans TaxID=999894 RepID=A0A179D2D3_9BACT|nr:restriction endonuclease subunit S [Thermosulfurimonas dismutans]OAQ19971.1 Type I restriction-modification system, specificity subunit S [Thermosulfurimonas dismutans]